MTDIVERFDISLFERATNVMAIWIMRFRVDDDQWDEVPSENDRLTAGHLAGALSAQGLLADPDALSSRDAEIERLRAALTIADESIRHHLRSGEISYALIQKHAVAAIREALYEQIAEEK